MQFNIKTYLICVWKNLYLWMIATNVCLLSIVTMIVLCQCWQKFVNLLFMEKIKEIHLVLDILSCPDEENPLVVVRSIDGRAITFVEFDSLPLSVKDIFTTVNTTQIRTSQ